MSARLLGAHVPLEVKETHELAVTVVASHRGEGDERIAQAIGAVERALLVLKDAREELTDALEEAHATSLPAGTGNNLSAAIPLRPAR